MGKFNFAKLVGALVLTVGLGGVSGLFTIKQIGSWYAVLNKPSFNPPNYIFGPVWSVLYIFMGISLYLVWNEPESPKRDSAIRLFIIQFILNISWSFIFFHEHEIFLAFIDILLMWIFLFFTIIPFFKIKSLAGWLLIPYICWVSYAIVLNFAIYNFNR